MDKLELVVDRSQPIPFQHEGRDLKVRPMPLRLALKLNEPNADGELTVGTDVMAEIISECVRFEDGSTVYTTDEVMDADSDMMIPLFQAITGMFSPEDAGKN